MFNSPYQVAIRNFEGVVESRLDPLGLHRVQVRVFGIHTDNLIQIPTKSLHWMQVMHPTTSPANSGVSQTPCLLEGTHVVGYFRDGDLCQDGIVIGTIAGVPQQQRNQYKGFSDQRTILGSSDVPGKPANVEYPNGNSISVTETSRAPYPNRLDEPDTSRLARNSNSDSGTVLQHKKKSQKTQTSISTASGSTFSEPLPPYDAKYPYNIVSEFESGHVLEFDNTPSKERVHIAHRLGSFVEMHSNGDVVNKAVKDNYDIVHGSSYEHIEGSKTVVIDKGASLYINAEGSNSTYLIRVGANGDLEIKVDSGNIKVDVSGDINIACTGNFNVEASGDFNVIANTINLN